MVPSISLIFGTCVYEMHFLKISASFDIYSLSYNMLKNDLTFGQIEVLTISVFQSDTVTLFWHIIDNSLFEPTNNHSLFGKSVLGVKSCAH